jgi:hypothetical protein
MSGCGSRERLNRRIQEVTRQKYFYAGLRTHEEKIKDFLLFLATVFTPSSTRWTWSPGDEVPFGVGGSSTMTMLSDDLTEISDDMRCVISQDVTIDAVKAADGHVYSGHDLQQWFAIRKSSPLRGTAL